MTEETLFHEALSKPASERSAFLDAACADKPELRAAVEALLAAHDASGGLLDQPPGDLGQTVDSTPGHDPEFTGAHVPGEEHSLEPRLRNEAGIVIGGRYTLVEKLGEGGMGEVWVAKQSEPVKRKVALKLIKTGMDTRAVLTRFEQERQALALMDHPNIARVLDGGMTPTGQPFFVMELVNGLALTKFCDEMKLTPKQRLELFVPICQAVQHAHQKGIVHRDLKPANILVTMIDGRPVPKVIDFGVAKAVSGKLTEETLSTQFGAVVGTLEYMSPEQAGFSGQDIDTRADIYSLGVILYELLTGLRPIDNKRLRKAAMTEMVRMICEEEPSKPSTRLSTDEALPSLAALRQMDPKKLMAMLRGELDWVIMKCLEKQRDRRYETANALSRDIQRYLADEPVEARSPSIGYRFTKFIRRHRGAVLTATLVVASLVIGATVALWQAIVAKRAEQEATRERDAAEKAREAEGAAHRQTEIALAESREKTARMTYERAQALCEEGKADIGLLWMARSLELTPPQSRDLDRAFRTGLNLWAGRMTTIRPTPLVPEWRRGPSVLDVAVSPDGLSLITANGDGNTRIWDLNTGKLRFTLPLENGAKPTQPFTSRRCVFSRNGEYVAATRGDPFCRIWSTVTSQLIGKPLKQEEPITGLSFHPDGKKLATCAGKQIQVWNVQDGTPDGKPLVSEEPALGLEVHREGRLLLVWGKKQLKVWDLTARKVLHVLPGVDFLIFHACFSPDGRYVLANGQKQTPMGRWDTSAAQIWEVESGKPVGAQIVWDDGGPAGGYPKAAFRPDGRMIVTGGRIRIWEVPTGHSLGVLGPEMYSNSPVFSRDGTRLIGTNPFLTDGTDHWQVLDVAPTLLPDRQIPLKGTDVFSLTVAHDGRSAATSIWTATTHRCHLYNLTLGRAIGDPIDAEAPTSSTTPIRPAFRFDGTQVATPVGKNDCQIWDTTTGRAIGPRLRMNVAVRALAFSPDGQQIAAGDLDGEVRLWHTNSGQATGIVLKNQYTVRHLRFSPDGKTLVAAGGRPGTIVGEARVWDLTTGKPLGPPLDIHGEVRDIAISPDGTSFATGAFQLILWDITTSKQLWTAPVFAVNDQVAFSPDGTRILARQFEEKSARLFDAKTGKPAGPHLRHHEELSQALFSPDGRIILTCALDGTTKLWDTVTGLPLGPGWTHGMKKVPGGFGINGRSLWLVEPTSLSRWDLPTPMTGSIEQIRLAVEVSTRQSLDLYGGAKPLYPAILPDPSRKKAAIWGPDPFEPAWKRLVEIGGPPGQFRR